MLEARDITVKFGDFAALSSVNLSLGPGHIMGLVGENGAGKSTLLKVLCGIYTHHSGTIVIDGQVQNYRTPNEAQAAGISVVHQELNLIPELTVAENIFLGRESTSGLLINRAEQSAQASDLLKRVGANFGPDELVSNLSLASQQLVEIAKALSQNARFLILDEPTAVLSHVEVERLFKLVLELKEQGLGVVFVSHHLQEVVALCGPVTVLRDGQNASNFEEGSYDERALAHAMVGREIANIYPAKNLSVVSEPILEVHSLSDAYLKDINFQARAGEIVGLGGLVGSGRTETLEAIAGIRKASGAVNVSGDNISDSVQARLKSGIGLVHEDRKGTGLHLDLSIGENLALPSLTISSEVQPNRYESVSANWKEKLQIRYQDQRQAVGTLSGGNQQKVSLGKWLNTNPKVVLLDEPTRGVDIGAKLEIYQLIADLAKTGLAVVIASSDMPELLGLCHRFLVMREGRIVGELTGNEMTETNVMELAAGVVTV